MHFHLGKGLVALVLQLGCGSFFIGTFRMSINCNYTPALLQKARQSGVVEIKISYEGSFAKLEDALEKNLI